MNSFLSRWRIGTRLALAFAIILVLTVVATSMAILHSRQNSEATRQMMAAPLAKERLSADMRALITAAIWRTSMIARSTDDNLALTFAEAQADGTSQVSAVMKQIEALLDTEQDKAMFAAITALRTTY
jgi:methyl-accepting chemotaxis protein